MIGAKDGGVWERVRAGGTRGALKDRLVRLRLDATLAVQSGLAAGLSWFVAHNLLGHPAPIFAPIAAVVVLGVAVGQRWRRALELVAGVALGIGVGDVLVLLIGVGSLQIMAVVTLAILVAVAFGGGSVAMGQAASAAVLVATIAPPTGGISVDRFIDTLTGGLAGLLVMALLLPFNPLTRVRHSAGKAMVETASALRLTADALRTGDPDRARRALNALRSHDSDHADLAASITVGQETATLAPMRWRAKGALDQYVRAAVHVERATRNARVLTRRTVTALEDDEAVPDDLPYAVEFLAEAVETLRRELSEGVSPLRSRQLALEAARAAERAYRRGVGFSGSVVVAQVRSCVTDLLRATGLGEARATRLMRRAVRTVAVG